MIEKEMVYLEWIDSMEHQGWLFLDEIKFEMKPVHSIGWIIKETENSISICSHLTNNDQQCCSMMTIPKLIITKRLTLTTISLPAV